MSDEVKKDVEEVVEDDVAIKEAAASVAAEESLESKVRDKMADIFSSEDNTEENDTEEDDTEEEDVEEDGKTREGDKTKEGEDDKVTDDATSKGEKKTDDETLTLPASHIQTANRLGISEDKVKELFDKNPEFMIAALKELHTGENKLSARYAQMGRAIREKQIADVKTEADKESSPESFVDIKKLKEQYEDGDEENILIDKVIKPLNDALVAVSKKVNAQVQPTDQSAYSQQEDRAIQSEVNNFFASDTLNGFREYYGTLEPGDDPRVVLTGAQFKHRGEVCQQGNYIRLGAEQSGEPLVITDVLQRAHLQLTESMREETIREDISSKIKKRAKGLSVKAGVKEVPKAKSAKDAETQLEVKTKARLDKIFK